MHYNRLLQPNFTNIDKTCAQEKTVNSFDRSPEWAESTYGSIHQSINKCLNLLYLSMAPCVGGIFKQVSPDIDFILGSQPIVVFL